MHPHPYGVLPAGNALLGSGGDCRETGLGALRALSDALLLDVWSYLSTADLAARLAPCSRACYVWAHCEEVHRAAVLSRVGGDFDFAASWRETAQRLAGRPPGAPPHRPLRVRGFYSDLLYRAHHVAATRIEPGWLARDNLPRLRADALSPAEFAARFDAPGLPCVLTGATAAWGALRTWVEPAAGGGGGGGGGEPAPPAASPHAALLRRVGHVRFDVGSYQMSLARYAAYAAHAAADDQPLLLFDPAAFGKAPGLLADWATPAHFSDDAFAALGPARRPHHRWLIAGPTGSGSVWHVDPNATSAYNAVVAGRKLWLMWPPGGRPPPGVYPSSDGASVEQPMSIVEWALDFYRHAARAGGGGGAGGVSWPDGATAASVPRALYQTIAHPGDAVYVPAGWWHAVINLGDPAQPGALTLAVTENFASRCGLHRVLRWCARHRASVSGCVPPERGSRLFEELCGALRESDPQLLDEALARVAREEEEEGGGGGEARAGGSDEGGAAPPPRKRQRAGGGWAAVVLGAAPGAGPLAHAAPAAAAAAGEGPPAAAGGGSGQGGFAFGFDVAHL